MRPVILDYTTHPISAAQALENMLNAWADNKLTPIMLVSEKGTILTRVLNIRTYLSKMRSRVPNSSKFSFTMSETFSTGVEPKHEAIILRWHMTDLQRVHNIMREHSSDEDVKLLKEMSASMAIKKN